MILTWIMGFFVFVFLLIIMPNDLAYFKSLTEMGILDTKLFYHPDQVRIIGVAYGSEGRETYILSKLTLDLIFPIIYSLFFTLSFMFFSHGKPRRYEIACVLAAFMADMVENASLALYFWQFDRDITIICWIASASTLVKWIMIFTVLLLLARVVSRYFLGIGKSIS